jgi:putative ABC transport system substrate-binding protein
LLISTIAIVALAGCVRRAQEDRPTKRIALVYIGPHELINQIVEGFKDSVTTGGAGTIEVIEKHANGDKSQVSTTVSSAVALRPDLIATITTPASQVALKNAPKGLPLVFVGVTDPVGAGLVKTMENPVSSTGVSDLAPIERLLRLIHEISPNITKLGLPFSPDEEPAQYSRKLAERLGPDLGFVIDARPVTSRDDLPSLVTSLARNNDAIIVGADNAMFEAAPNIAKIAQDNRRPFFAADSTSIKAGALAGVTIDYRKVGAEGGRLALRVLSGENAGSIPVVLMQEGNIEVNLSAMRTLGLALPNGVLNSARTTYK